MDFLNKATDKLNVKDLESKLPADVKNKIPGKSDQGGGKNEGKHLSSSNSGGGFPDGVRPEHWMGDLVKKGNVPGSALITEFAYPGSHDCATYGSGAASFSYQCQEKDLYEQMKVGQRAFDLRLAPAEGKDGKFIPIHGVAKNTADDFNEDVKKAKDKDLATQIMKYAKEHPTEILVFQVRVEDIAKGDAKKDFAEAVWNILGPRLLQAPGKGQKPVTYDAAVKSNRNIVWGSNIDFEGPIESYIWTVGKNTPSWIGAGHPKLWNEPTWQSGDIKKVLDSTEEFMKENENHLHERSQFWVANLQLTPVLGQSISTFISSGGSIRPKDLALGGGMGTHGSFKGSNKELRECGRLNTTMWKKFASCLIYDFCDTDTTGDIVSMNVGRSFSGGGGAGGAGGAGAGAAGSGTGRPGAGTAVTEENDRPGKHGGKKGGHGKDDDDDDGPGKRGGHGGGGHGKRGDHH